MTETSPDPTARSPAWVVLKFGGTSVAGREQWLRIAELAGQRRAEGLHVVLVCSALAGVTNALQALADAREGHSAMIAALVERHRALAAALAVDATGTLEAAVADLRAALALARGPARDAALLAQGERLSTRIGAQYLSGLMEVAWVDAREALVALPEPDPGHPRSWLSARCAAGPDPALARRWAMHAPVLVCPGFVAANAAGDTVLLGRGGSDTSAALLAGRLGARRVEIWTDVPGIFSADPRREPEARLIPALCYEEALELAASGAKVIHGQAIRAAAEAGVPLSIHDLSHPLAAGTRVGEPAPPAPSGVRAVATQQRMAVLLLENLDTRQQVGFLAGVFAAIAREGVSVDLVATSETTTTLAVNRATNHLDDDRLAGLVAALQPLCRVTCFPDCATVNLVGRGASRALAGLGGLRGLLGEGRLLMTSQSANDLGVSLLVRAADADELAGRLHRDLVVTG